MKRILFLLCLGLNITLYSSQSLVVGSIREKDDTLPYFLKNLWQEDKADFSYLKKISIDLKKPKIKCLNIVADAAEHTFPEKCLKSVYIERLPSFYIYQETLRSSSGVLTPVNRVKFPLVRTIFNLKPAMADNAILAVEWFASCTINCQPTAVLNLTEDDLFLEETFPFCKNELKNMFNIEKELENNPFHCFINKSLLCTTLYNVATQNSQQNFSVSSNTLISALKNTPQKKTLPASLKKKFLTFCKERNFSLFDKSLTQSELTKQVMINCLCLEKNSRILAPTIQELLNLYQEKEILGKDITIQETIKNDLEKMNLLSSSEEMKSFFNNSILELFALDSAIIFLSPYVKNWMDKHGFDCTIERKKSEGNGRENVWIIEATKR